MEEIEPTTIERFENASDSELEHIIAKAKSVLSERHARRKSEALTRIREIAKEHGLIVDVRTSRRQRRSKTTPTNSEKAA
jgi:hypothetical protein